MAKFFGNPLFQALYSLWFYTVRAGRLQILAFLPEDTYFIDK